MKGCASRGDVSRRVGIRDHAVRDGDGPLGVGSRSEAQAEFRGSRRSGGATAIRRGATAEAHLDTAQSEPLEQGAVLGPRGLGGILGMEAHGERDSCEQESGGAHWNG